MMNWYGISNILAAITSVYIAIFLFIKGYKNKISRIWSVFSICVAIYGFGAYMASGAKNYDLAFWWWQFSYVGVILLPVLFLIFVYEFLNIKKRTLINIVAFITVVMLLADIFSKELFIGHVSLLFTDSKLFKPAWWVYPPGPLHIFYTLVFYFVFLIYGHIKLLKAYSISSSLKKHQIKYFFLATALGFMGGGTSFLPCFGINIYPIYNLTVPLYPLIMTYAIFRHRLMDINIAVTRAGIFALMTVVTIATAFGIASLTEGALTARLGANWYRVSLLISMLLAAFGYAISIYLIRRMDRVRLSKINKAQESLEIAGRKMIEFGDLHRIARIIPRYLLGLYYQQLSVRINHITIFLYDERRDRFVLEKSAGVQKIIRTKELPVSDAFNIWFTEKRAFFVEKLKIPQKDIDVLRYEDIDYWLHNKITSEDATLIELLQQMKREMDELNSVICIPSVFDNKLLGFLLLGNKDRGTYDQEELDIFLRLATNAAAAFRSAQLTDQIKQMQMGLIASGQLAAIGRLATSAKHEVNNPLQGIYGSIQRVLAYLQGTGDGYKLIKERINEYKVKIDDTFSDLLKNETTVGSDKISAIKEKLKLVGQTFAIINERVVDDENFAQNVETNIKNIGDFQVTLKDYSAAISEEKIKDQFDEISLLLETIKHVLDNIKKLNQMMFEIIKKGKVDCERIAEVIEIMYHLPRPDAKDKTEFTIEELLTQTFSFVRFQTYWENLTDTPIEKDIPKDFPKIRGFMGHLAVTFLNLIMNAYQAMTDAGLTLKTQRLLRITANVIKDDPDFVEIRFSNKGPLIPENDLERIFEAGFTTKKKGTGLGLNISKAIVEFYNNGSIYARNITDFGPEFVIKLPRAREVNKHDTENAHN